MQECRKSARLVSVTGIMPRRLRFHPPHALVEVTCRTVHGRFLLQPTSEVAELCRGILARSARLYPVRVHAFVFLGNHYHLLLSAPSARRLASFMGYLNSNLAREVGRLVGWREKFWSRRYQSIVVSAEEGAQVGRLLYLLRHGCKEGLVRRPSEWPGASSVRELLAGSAVVGTWVDRTALDRTSRRGKVADTREHEATERLELAPLPCWSHLDAESHRLRVRELIHVVEREAERRITDSGLRPLGRVRLTRQDPLASPARPKRAPAPLVHAISEAVRSAFREAYRAFVAAFRAAAARIRASIPLWKTLDLFPSDSFPPTGSSLGLGRASPG